MAGINLVGIDPQVARLQAAFFIFTQANNGWFSHGAHILLAGKGAMIT